MKFTCKRDSLVEGINTVQKAVPAKTTMPILEGILIEVDEKLLLTGNDLEMGIEYEVEAVIEEPGKIVVNSKTFGEIVRKLPDVFVTIEVKRDSMISVTSGKAFFELRTVSAEAFPKIVPIEHEKEIIILQQELKNLIRQTIFAASIEESRPILKGVLIEKKENFLNFVAIDGYKLAYKQILCEADAEVKVVAPARILNELSKILQGGESKITFCTSDNQIMFYTENYKMISRLLKGEYMNYNAMIPREFTMNLDVNTKDLLSGIERVSLVMSDDKKFPLFVNIDSENVVISANAENGISREEIPAEINGEGIEMGFNPRNIIDCIKVIEAENIKISFTSSICPCVITPLEGETFTYLVMPVKTKG
jgi:DNA polymerase-3 subunit beta